VNTTQFTKGSKGPIFFIPGGEWSLGPTKAILYGMAHDLAIENKGLMVAVRHRCLLASPRRRRKQPTPLVDVFHLLALC
jgi:hypothetical protein